MSTKNTHPRPDIRQILIDVDHETSLAYTTVHALRGVVKTLRERVCFQFTCHKGSEIIRITDPSSRLGELNNLATHPTVQELSGAQTVLEVLENSEQFAVAEKLIVPLLAELDALIQLEQAEWKEQSEKTAKRNSALAKIDADAAEAKAALAEA